MIAGTLELQLMANMARLQSDMEAAKRLVGGAMGEIDKMASMAKAALGALGGALSVGAFVSWSRAAIEAADSLNDLSKSTGLAVEQLAGLKLAAKQSGADLEGTAQAINKLSVKMGENAEKYAKIGVTAKAPLEAFKQLADIFTKIDDPQLRAAFGAEALGKNWAAAAPLLSEGSAGIQEMVDKGVLLSGMTQDAADLRRRRDPLSRRARQQVRIQRRHGRQHAHRLLHPRNLPRAGHRRCDLTGRQPVTRTDRSAFYLRG